MSCPNSPGLGHDVEAPEHAAGLGVVAADVAGNVLLPLRVVAPVVRVAHDDDAVHHDGRRARSDVSGIEDPPVGVHGVVPHPEVQIDDPSQPEEGKQVTRFGVQGHQVVAGCDQEDGGAALHLGVGHGLSVVLAGGGFPAGVVPLPPHPEGLARGRVDGHDGAALPGHRVEPVADLDGRAPVDVVGLGAIVEGGPAPGHLELGDVLGRDLVERRVPAASLVRAPVAPFSFLRPLPLGRYRWGTESQRGGEGCRDERGPAECALGHGVFLHLMRIFPSTSGDSGSSSPPVGMSFRARM